MYVTVNLKSLAKRKNDVCSMPFCLADKPGTVRELIEAVVWTCVEDFNERGNCRDIFACLSQVRIDDMVQSGKVSFCDSEKRCEADYQMALESALQAYEDGIYRIFIDGEETGGLDSLVEMAEGCSLTFVRLTMLAGRLW